MCILVCILTINYFVVQKLEVARCLFIAATKPTACWDNYGGGVFFGCEVYCVGALYRHPASEMRHGL